MFEFLKELPDGEDSQRRDRKKNVLFTGGGLLVWLLVSSFCLLFLALHEAAGEPPGARLEGFLDVISSSALLAAAFLSIGALLGFVFGIPRVPKATIVATPQRPPTAGSGPAPSPPPIQTEQRLTPNTNLEDISDWLTKILIGAGLAQLAVLPGKLSALADFFERSMPFSAAAALLILLNYFILGFMGSYLLTRLFLTEAFRSVEESGAERFGRAARDLLLEIAPVAPNAPKEERDAKYEAYIYTCLYLDPPEGFERTIKAALDYLDSAGDQPNPRILAYLAMAYGQKYDWEQRHWASKDVLNALRNSALAAAQRAITIEPKLRSLLRMTWDPNDPSKLRGEENDLEAFYNDPDFKKILDPQTA